MSKFEIKELFKKAAEKFSNLPGDYELLKQKLKTAEVDLDSGAEDKINRVKCIARIVKHYLDALSPKTREQTILYCLTSLNLFDTNGYTYQDAIKRARLFIQSDKKTAA